MSAKTATKRLINAVRIAPITHRDEATAIAAATAELYTAQKKAAVVRDERVAALEMEFNLAIEEYQNEIERNTKRLASWAVRNRESEFGTKKTIYLAGHKLSFREGTGKVEFSPGTKEEEALNIILSQEDDSVIERFTNIKTTLNKNAVLTAWKNSDTLREFLTTCGITVTKEEKFSFEPDHDAVPENGSIKVGEATA